MVHMTEDGKLTRNNDEHLFDVPGICGTGSLRLSRILQIGVPVSFQCCYYQSKVPRSISLSMRNFFSVYIKLK